MKRKTKKMKRKTEKMKRKRKEENVRLEIKKFACSLVFVQAIKKKVEKKKETFD